MQFALDKEIYLFDILSLKKNDTFIDFLYDLFEATDITKIVHTFRNDLKEINATFGTKINFKNKNQKKCVKDLTQMLMRKNNQ